MDPTGGGPYSFNPSPLDKNLCPFSDIHFIDLLFSEFANPLIIVKLAFLDASSVNNFFFIIISKLFNVATTYWLVKKITQLSTFIIVRLRLKYKYFSMF